MTELHSDLVLDLSQLQCPLPLLKTKLALNNMQPRQVVKVIATDPGSEKDFHLFVSQSNHRILGFEKDADRFLYWIERG